MTSAGGLVDPSRYRGRDSVLSGPAGGVVALQEVARQLGLESVVGFDMGGTSTDVSRWAGELAFETETRKAGVRLATPMLAIETVAAGGGSVCSFDGQKLAVGPASAGSEPGPISYGRGGPLALTDINLFLGRLRPEHFPLSPRSSGRGGGPREAGRRDRRSCRGEAVCRPDRRGVPADRELEDGRGHSSDLGGSRFRPRRHGAGELWRRRRTTRMLGRQGTGNRQGDRPSPGGNPERLRDGRGEEFGVSRSAQSCVGSKTASRRR